jgi:hypothetical protein
MEIGGTGLKDTNIIFRLLAVSFAGIMVFAILLSWRAQLLFNAEYVELPHGKLIRDADDQASQSAAEKAPATKQTKLQ